jgi:hypothetical protein
MEDFISALDGSEWSAASSGHFIPGIHSMGGWVGPTGGPEAVAKRKILPLSKIELRSSSQ